VGLDIEPFVRDVVEARKREDAFLASTGHTGEVPPLELLAVSGGGDNGAFGAGLLCGWTEAGNRPQFKAVTGISTGALIAPFAFLGSDYDHVLRTVYTSVKPTDIATRRNLLAAIANDGMADNSPLWELISKFVDQSFLDKIAEEHQHGRVLLIGTTDLDARQPVMWNMGIIASSKAPGALELFRGILLASAAIPGAFPPKMIRVDVDGKPYEEMHVDGGASTQVFLYPPSMKYVAAALGETMSRTGHVAHPYPGDRGSLPDLCHHAAGWARFQPGAHRERLPVRQERGFRHTLHGRAVRLRLPPGQGGVCVEEIAPRAGSAARQVASLTATVFPPPAATPQSSSE
jgi:hypothetical protein